MIRDRLPRPIRRAGRWAKQQINPRGVILMYHRIAEEPFDPWNLCVSPGNFTEQLEVLRSSGLRVMHLRELAGSLASGKLPKRSVVLTFDDGYLDNLENGRPLLERYGIPATTFIASGYLSSTGEFWWDAMERVLLTAGKLPEKFEVEIDGERRSWELNDDAAWTDKDAERYRDWRPYTQAHTARQRLYQELRELVLRASPTDRARVIAELLEWAGVPATARPKRRILDEEGLRRLAAGDLIDIGGHSISHPELANLSVSEQDHELRTSKARLERILGREVTALAYPHGSCNADTKRLAREAGYAFACGTQRRSVQRDADRYELPRIGVRNVPSAEFKAMLAEFLPL
jgi:peptidoglycan/xylan/chitin deacetylase (PgdA/CDA1 family)